MSDPPKGGAPATTSEARIDGLARRLAYPMARRRALAVFAGSLAAAALPRLVRPGALHAAAGDVICQEAIPQVCNEAACSEGFFCCCAPSSSTSPCKGNCHCCDPCDPSSSQCNGDGTCSGGPINAAVCCRREGKVACGDSCCDAGGICADHSAGICCQPRRPGLAYDCGKSDSRCLKSIKNIYARDISACRGAYRRQQQGAGHGSYLRGTLLDRSALKYLECVNDAVRDANKLYKECPQLPDNRYCGPDGLCAADSLRCCDHASVAQPASRSMQQIADPVERSGDRPAGRASAARVSKEELRNRLHRQGPRLNRSYRRFDDAQSAYTDTGKAVTALANACDGYRRDVLALRKSLAAGRGGRPQRLLLTTYDAVAAALAAYKKGILFETKAEGQRALAHSKAEWRRASRYAVEARRALD